MTDGDEILAADGDRSFFSKNGTAVISLKLHSIAQLFSAMDPAPFRKKGLNPSVQEWIVSSAAESPLHAPLELMIYLQDSEDISRLQPTVRESVQAFFAYKSQLSRRQLSQMFKRGRTSLLIGLSFLGVTLAISKLLDAFEQNRVAALIRESLIIGGWVAMWRPLEILLYDWWPIRNERLVFDRLGRMDVTVREESAERSEEPSRT